MLGLCCGAGVSAAAAGAGVSAAAAGGGYSRVAAVLRHLLTVASLVEGPG